MNPIARQSASTHSADTHIRRYSTNHLIQSLQKGSMSTYKLVYFNLRARAELTRLIFAQAGVEYTDERLEFQDWPARAPNTPFGVLPVLEVNGQQLGGSLVIARYVAEKHGLGGANDWENALIDSALDALSDGIQKIAPIVFEKDEAKKAELKKTAEEEIHFTLTNLEKFAAANKDGWLVGSKVTYGDLAVFNALSNLAGFWPAVLDKYTTLAQIKQRVEELPRIAKWLKDRPVTFF